MKTDCNGQEAIPADSSVKENYRSFLDSLPHVDAQHAGAVKHVEPGPEPKPTGKKDSDTDLSFLSSLPVPKARTQPSPPVGKEAPGTGPGEEKKSSLDDHLAFLGNIAKVSGKGAGAVKVAEAAAPVQEPAPSTPAKVKKAKAKKIVQKTNQAKLQHEEKDRQEKERARERKAERIRRQQEAQAQTASVPERKPSAKKGFALINSIRKNRKK